MNLADLLLDHGIRVALDPDRPSDINCPRCEGGGSHEKKTLWVAVHRDGRGFTRHCHRATCEWHAKEHIRLPQIERAEPPPPSAKRQPTKPATLQPPPFAGCDEWAHAELFNP